LALGVTPLRVGQEAYWLDQIAHNRCEYYEEAAVRRLFAGQDPLTGEQRVVPLWRADPRSRLDAARPRRARLPGRITVVASVEPKGHLSRTSEARPSRHSASSSAGASRPILESASDLPDQAMHRRYCARHRAKHRVG
jgi:hypothetical protein